RGRAGSAHRHPPRDRARRCGLGACRRWASGWARAPAPGAHRKTGGAGSFRGLRAVTGDEPLGHVLVPPDAVEHELLVTVVEQPVLQTGPEKRHVSGPERGLDAVALDHRRAADGDEDLVLMVGVQGGPGTWLGQ